MSRKSCLDCVCKHLAQAQVLLDEAHLGYPHHRWLAVGHLAEAESECLDEQAEFARKIRECRLDVMQSLGRSKDACIESLLIEACLLAGEENDLVYDPRNSKVNVAARIARCCLRACQKIVTAHPMAARFQMK